MQSPVLTLSERTVVADEGARLDTPTDPNLQVLPGAQGCDLGNLTANVAGRDLRVVQYITNNSGPPSAELREPESIQSKRDTILRALAAPNFDATYAIALGQRMARTGAWFPESRDFQTFVGAKGVTLWCTGMPGAGKTILASTAVEHLRATAKQSPLIAVAFAFLRYSERHPWRDVLSSLLVQLIKKNDIACTVFWSHYSRAAADATSELVILENGLETALCDIASQLEKLYVVIDGLDEAPDEVKDRLVESLVSAGVNLLILSRPLQLYTHHAPKALLVPIQAQTKDIELYVRGEVRRSSRLSYIFQGKPEKISELCEKIIKQSDGMFLVARLQMEVIMRSSNSIATLFSNLKALPAGVNAMYDLTLSRIGDSEDASIAFRAFIWVSAYAERKVFGDIQADVLQCALSFNEKARAFDTDATTPLPLILSACQGLLTQNYDKISRTTRVRFVHYSTYEYMKTAKLDVGDPHSLLDFTCFSYMEDHREHLLNLCRNNYPKAWNHVYEHPFLGFSYQYWSEHVTQARLPGGCPNIRLLLSKHREYPIRLPTVPWRMEVMAGVNLAVIYNFIDKERASPNAELSPATKSTPGGYTPFHLSAMFGQFETFQVLLSSHSGVDLPAWDGSTMLHIAVDHNQTTFVKLLHSLVTIFQGNDLKPQFSVDVNAQNCNGMTPLMFAIRRGNEELVKLLLSWHGVDINIQDKSGKSAFDHCIGNTFTWNPNLEGISTSVQRWDNLAKMMCSIPSFDLRRHVNKAGSGIFLGACWAGLRETVRYIWDACERDPKLVHQVNKRKETALWMVCDSTRYEKWGPLVEDIFTLLVTGGSDLRAQNVAGITPFLCAIQRHARQSLHRPPGPYDAHPLKLAEKLLALDPTLIDQRDHRGRTALMVAIDANLRSVATVRWILERRGSNADFVNAQNLHGRTALVQACYLGGTDVVAALLALPCLDVPSHPFRHSGPIDWMFRHKSTDQETELRMVEILASAMCSDRWLVRTAFASAACRAAIDPTREMRRHHFEELFGLFKRAPTRRLDDNDTIVFLAYAARSICRIPVVFLLVSLDLLPMSTFKFEREAVGVCSRPGCSHDSFRWASGFYPAAGALRRRFHEADAE